MSGSVRFMIAGTNSGCGKTTVACAVLAALKRRGVDVGAFKAGPDYIDTMFHREVIGIPSHNLDSFFCGEKLLRGLMNEYSRDVNVIEGVMGYFDGRLNAGNDKGDEGSSRSVAVMTATPAVIVLNCRGMSDSMGAVMRGFLDYRRPNNIAGFIFDRLPEKLVPLAKRLCDEQGTEYFGHLPPTKAVFESRHLGLVTAAEVGDIHEKLEELGRLAEEHICIDKLLSLTAPDLTERLEIAPVTGSRTPVIAAARDKAFCFYYDENYDLLEKLGYKVEFFSPLEDRELPPCEGIWLCGGYPELYAEQLSANLSMRESVKRAVVGGLPTVAECGGFLYLHDTLETEGGRVFSMAGAIRAHAYPAGSLKRFGYVSITAREDNLLCRAGETLKAHEFHYWESTDSGSDFHAIKPNGTEWNCAHAHPTLYAGFPHLYLYQCVILEKLGGVEDDGI